MRNSPCRTHIWTIGLPLFAAALLFARGVVGEEIKLPWTNSGVTKKVGYYLPVRLTVSAEKPEGLAKAPAGLEAPLYAEFKLGVADSTTPFFVILDEPDGRSPRLFVGAKGIGDLSSVAPVVMSERPYESEGNNYSKFACGVELPVAYGSETAGFHLEFYRLDKRDPQRASLPNALYYYRDYGRAGEISLGGKRFNAILVEDTSTGDFRGTQERPTRLFVDVNHDGKYQMNSESFIVGKPFNVEGVAYDFSGVNASGDSFQIARSSQAVDEAPPTPKLTAGQKAPAFQARTTDGQRISFPDAYKGKVVLLDFWATWCGPCVTELPNLAAAYEKFHPKGFDILAVSLDRENEGQRLARFTSRNHMIWPQIYDGKYWHGAIAETYAVDSIPRAYLVDGTTGTILAEGKAVRGEGLTTALEKALSNINARQN